MADTDAVYYQFRIILAEPIKIKPRACVRRSSSVNDWLVGLVEIDDMMTKTPFIPSEECGEDLNRNTDE